MKKWMIILCCIPICASILFVGGGVSADSAGKQAKPAEVRKVEKTVVDVLREEGSFTIFVAALESTGLDETLKTSDPVTVLAPTDEAFDRVPKMSELLKDKPRLRAVLSGHIILDKRMDSADIAAESTLQPLEGATLKVKGDNDMKINDARVVHINIIAPNGIAHGLDKVLMANNESFMKDAGETVETNVKKGAHTVFNGLKSGANKVKETFAK